MVKKPLQIQNNPLFSGPSLKSRTLSGSPYREIPLSEIEPDRNQPRQEFDPEAIAELAASIEQYGVLSPILVRLAASGMYQIIAGERRYRASKILGRETIPAIVDTDENSDVILSKQLVENLQRQDLNPLDRAIAIGKLRDASQSSIREIAEKLSISKSFVQRSLDILQLPDDLLAALRNGASESKILLLAGIKDKSERQELLSKLDTLNRDEIAEKVAKISPKSKKKVVHRGTDSGDERIRTQLEATLRTKVTIIRNKGNSKHGKLLIEFYSDDELSELYTRLTR